MLGHHFKKLIDLIKRARITKPGPDDADYNVQQISYFDKVADAEMVFPYGMSANLPKDSLVLLFNVNGNEQNRAGIGSLPPERKRNLEDGEVAFFHPLTKSFIYFRNRGHIEIDTGKARVYTAQSGGAGAFSDAFNFAFDSYDEGQSQEEVGADIILRCNNLDVTCNESSTINVAQNVTLTAGGAVDVTCETATLNANSSATFNTPIATFSTDVTINGNLTVVGGSSLSGTVTSGGTNIGNSHVHPILGGSSAPGPTGGPQ